MIGSEQSALAAAMRDVAEHVDTLGWGQPPVVFALVTTADLIAAEPSLLDQLDADVPYTPIEQAGLPDDSMHGQPAIDELIASLSWPDSVAGCVWVQEILVLPPGSESELAGEDNDRLRIAAEQHPERTTARLFAGVLRGGARQALLQLPPDDDDPFPGLDLREYPGLAHDLLAALADTLSADEPD